MILIICYIVLGLVYFCAPFINDAFIHDERIYLLLFGRIYSMFTFKKKGRKKTFDAISRAIGIIWFVLALLTFYKDYVAS